jgi:hypothetical protein
MTKSATARQYPEQQGLRQIETRRRRREPLDNTETQAHASREAKGWTPQAEPSGVFESWWEQPAQS